MTTLQIYKTYSFRNKDPIIDKLRTIKNDTGFTDTEISDRSGVSTTTLYNWFLGKTRRPQHASTMAVARAMGYDYQLVKVNEASEGKKPKSIRRASHPYDPHKTA